MTPGCASRIIASAVLLKMKPRFEVRASAEGNRAKGRKGLGLAQHLPVSARVFEFGEKRRLESMGDIPEDIKIYHNIS